MRSLRLAVAFLLAVISPAPAYAGAGRPTPQPLPADVWVNPTADLGVSAYFAATFVNRYTATKLICAYPSPDSDGCVPAPCPSSRMCLIIRWGGFADDSLDARYIARLCSGVCTKSGLIEINPEGPLFGRFNPWGPFQYRLLLEQMIGIFAGLTPQAVCVSSMSHYSCSIEGFTAGEAQHLARW